MDLNKSLTIVFDFGNVLVDWDPRYLYRKLFPDNEAAMELFLEEVDFIGWNQQQDEGRTFAEGVADLCDRFPDYCDLIRAYDERWEESLGGPIWQTVKVLRRLKQAGYPLYGLSNWSGEKFRLVCDQYHFFGWFEDIVLSGDVRLAKPDERIFQLLLDRIEKTAGECLLIDDSLENIMAARDLGFEIIHFTSAEQLEAELCERDILCGTQQV
jgi:2-haloacid dehalogenase